MKHRMSMLLLIGLLVAFDGLAQHQQGHGQGHGSAGPGPRAGSGPGAGPRAGSGPVRAPQRTFTTIPQPTPSPQSTAPAPPTPYVSPSAPTISGTPRPPRQEQVQSPTRQQQTQQSWRHEQPQQGRHHQQNWRHHNKNNRDHGSNTTTVIYPYYPYYPYNYYPYDYDQYDYGAPTHGYSNYTPSEPENEYPNRYYVCYQVDAAQTSDYHISCPYPVSWYSTDPQFDTYFYRTSYRPEYVCSNNSASEFLEFNSSDEAFDWANNYCDQDVPPSNLPK